MRISLIHAMAASVPPTEETFRRPWPDPTLMNLLDDSLAPDLASEGALTLSVTRRVHALAYDAASTGSDAVLFTCSAFGPFIEACQRALAQFGLARAAEAIAAATGKTVLTTPGSAVSKPRHLLSPAEAA